jgi:hypothetical protein
MRAPLDSKHARARSILPAMSRLLNLTATSALFMLAAGGCSGEPSPDNESANESAGELPDNVTVLGHEFETFDVEPGYEKDLLCQSWTLGNEEDLFVNAVAFQNDGAWHHSNWLFVPEHKFAGPDGTWDCVDRKYTELDAALAGGVLFAQGTQALDELQQFPEGVAVRVPAGSKVIGQTHILNASSEQITTQARMQLHTIPGDDVSVPLNPFRLNYGDLHIPPRSTAEFTGECNIQDRLPDAELDLNLYYVMPHYHYLGSQFRLEVFGGDRDGEVIVQHDGEPHGYTLDPPASLRGADGVRFTCRYENSRDDEVGYGIGDQEMCVMLGFAEADIILDGAVGEGTISAGEKDGVRQFNGPCNVIAAPADIGNRKY